MQEYLPVLLGMRLFEGISAEELPPLLRCLNAIKRTYLKGAQIYRMDDPVHGAGILLSGRAQVYTEDVQGARMIVSQLEAGELFAESFSCADEKLMPVAVEALTDCAVLFVDCGRIAATCSSSCAFHNRLIRNLMRVLAEKNIQQSRKIRHLSRRSTREKLLSYLGEQAALNRSAQFLIPFTRQELADYLCVDRSAMSAELSKLQREGVLSYHKSAFKLR